MKITTIQVYKGGQRPKAAAPFVGAAARYRRTYSGVTFYCLFAGALNILNFFISTPTQHFTFVDGWPLALALNRLALFQFRPVSEIHFFDH